MINVFTLLSKNIICFVIKKCLGSLTYGEWLSIKKFIFLNNYIIINIFNFFGCLFVIATILIIFKLTLIYASKCLQNMEKMMFKMHVYRISEKFSIVIYI